MADVQYTTLYLPDGTGVSVVVGSQLYLTYVASGATTSPPTFTPSTSTSPAAPDVRTPVATIWFNTPFGPQPITAPDIIDEYRRRDYAELTAAQAAAFYASGAEIPDVSFVTGVELPAAIAAQVSNPASATATALRAASGSQAADPTSPLRTELAKTFVPQRTYLGAPVPADGTLMSASSRADRLAGWGSSTMQQLAGPLIGMGNSLGASYWDGGKGGERIAHHLARLGAEPALLTFPGDSIPASGSVTVTATNTLTGGFPISAFLKPFTGTVAGVAGTLSSTDTAVTFTRTTAGDAVTVAAGAPFIPTDGVAHAGDTTLLNLGKNDLEGISGSGAVVVDGCARAIAYLTPLVKRVVVIGHFVNTDTVAEAPARTRIGQANTAWAARYGRAFIDLGGYITSAAVWRHTGITPTQADLDQQALGNKPASLSAASGTDVQHLNDAAKAAFVNNVLRPRLIELGWYPAASTPADLLFEYDMDVLRSTFADGADVTSLSPVAGSIVGGTLAAKASGAVWPKLTLAGPNGHAALDFPGNANIYNSGSTYFTVGVASTVIIVTRVDSITANSTYARVMSAGTSATSWRSLNVKAGAGGGAIASRVSDGTTTVLEGATGSLIGRWAVSVVVVDGATSSTRTGKGQPVIGTTPTPAMVGATLGSTFSTSAPLADGFLDGQIAYLAGWNRHLTDDEIDGIVGRLAAKFALTL